MTGRYDPTKTCPRFNRNIVFKDEDTDMCTTIYECGCREFEDWCDEPGFRYHTTDYYCDKCKYNCQEE